MNVKLISFTPDALNMLLGTKNTRLGFEEDPSTWSDEKKQEHLDYMRDTIKSSWEFVDYIFEISEVTRVFTHQFVRTRAGSYAQESQRTVDVADHGVTKPEFPNLDVFHGWNRTIAEIFAFYRFARQHGMPAQDARGIMPQNLQTSIRAKFNLRTLHEMAKTRLCVRTQGEYQDVFRAMRAEVIHVHPWAEQFIDVACVADGTCAFPRYGKEQCPIYDPRMDLVQLKADTKKKFWSSKRHVAIPVAKDGKTM